jgi:hypothetical protein
MLARAENCLLLFISAPLLPIVAGAFDDSTGQSAI